MKHLASTSLAALSAAACQPASRTDSSDRRLDDVLFADAAPAVGIYPRSLTVNQGVEVQLGGGTSVLDLVHGRDALIRVGWELDEDWITRPITANLAFRYADGGVGWLSQTMVVSTTPDLDAIEGMFSWSVPGRFMRPGSGTSVAFVEADPSFAREGCGRSCARLPERGTIDLSILEDDMRLSITFVPIRHRLAGHDCPPAPPIRLDDFRRKLQTLYPVADLDLQVGSALVVEGPTTSLRAARDAVVQRRALDMPAPQNFYIGVIDPCDRAEGNPAGLAAGFGDATQQGAFKRAVVVVEHDIDQPWKIFVAEDVAAHELGHALGRRHTDCGDAPQLDLEYPLPNAEIGAHGWDGMNLFPPDTPDLMSYCSPRWMSSYGWELVAPVIAELSSWPDHPSLDKSETWSVVGTQGERGELRLWVQPGAAQVSGEIAGRVELKTSSGDQIDVVVRSERSPHGERIFAGALPAITGLVSANYVGDGQPIRWPVSLHLWGAPPSHEER